ncbi:MAG: hypothetical protein KUG78_21945 [Kangiellaceae bacterium]|nr:hypothetical protein [Kangiellaceae bacterium]
MPKGFHYGRTQTRHYTCEYFKISAISFKKLIDSPVGKYKINSEHLSKEHSNFNLITTERWKRVLIFRIKEKQIPVPLNIDKRSASNKLYLICPYCSQQRQHLYAVSNAYGCRKCLDLQYACQSERPAERLARRIRKLRREIWRNEDWLDTVNLFERCEWYPKPKWMRWEKFNRERDKITNLENRYWKLQEPFMKQYAKMGIEW